MIARTIRWVVVVVLLLVVAWSWFLVLPSDDPPPTCPNPSAPPGWVYDCCHSGGCTVEGDIAP